MEKDINLRHLKYFLRVAELGSINKAAQTLFISQSYLGRIIKDLEDSVGLVLFTRTRGGVELTSDGEAFRPHAAGILREMQKITRFHSPGAKARSFSVSMTKYSHIMESFNELVLLHKDEPSFVYRLREGTANDVVDDLYTGQADIGVLHFSAIHRAEFRPQLELRGLEYHFLASVKPHILISEEHPLLKSGRPVCLKELSPYVFVRYAGQHEDFAYQILASHEQFNLSHNPRLVYVDSRSSLLRLISASDFYGLGIHDFEHQNCYGVKSIPIADSMDSFWFGYILPAGTKLTPLMREFLERVKKHLQVARETA